MKDYTSNQGFLILQLFNPFIHEYLKNMKLKRIFDNNFNLFLSVAMFYIHIKS